MEDLSAWLLLRAVKGLGPGTVSRLVLDFGSPQAVQTASVQELISRGGISLPVAERIHQGPNAQVLSAIEREITVVERGAFSVLTILDDDYPARLKAIADPPPLLYMTGALAGDRSSNYCHRRVAESHTGRFGIH